MNSTHNNRGLTLVAVMVGGAIIMVALAIAVSAFFSASRLTRNAAYFTRAGNFAEGVMEQVRSEPYDRLVSRAVKENLPDLPGARCEIVVSEREVGLKEARVICSWKEGDRERSVHYSTLAARSMSR